MDKPCASRFRGRRAADPARCGSDTSLRRADVRGYPLLAEAPAVIPFTTAVAAQAVTELLHRLTGFMGPIRLPWPNVVLKGSLGAGARSSARPHDGATAHPEVSTTGLHVDRGMNSDPRGRPLDSPSRREFLHEIEPHLTATTTRAGEEEPLCLVD